VQTGWLRTLLGDPEQATVRGGYSMTYGFERMDRFTGLYGGNPGGTTVATRNINFNHQAAPGGAADTFQVETAYTDINTTADPGGRIGQIQWRITW